MNTTHYPYLARLGSVDLDDISLLREPHLEDSDEFQRMNGQLKDSEEIYRFLDARGDVPLESLLTTALDRIAATSGLDGLIIASEEGLPVACSRGIGRRGDVVAAVSSLFQSTVRRATEECLIPSVEEMHLRGCGGEQVVMRFFPGRNERFVLLAYSSRRLAYRRATAHALRLCGKLLLLASGGELPDRKSLQALRQVLSAPTAAAAPGPPNPIHSNCSPSDNEGDLKFHG